MKNVITALTLLLLASCSDKTKFTESLTGRWMTYKILDHNIDITSAKRDSIDHATITYTASGQFTETDTPPNGAGIYTVSGTWTFQNDFGKLLLTDTVYHLRVYTILNLVGNHVELTKEGVTRYMRKIQ
jgi:hypothetical protein